MAGLTGVVNAIDTIVISLINTRNQSCYCVRSMQESDLDAVLAIEMIAQHHPWSSQSFLSSIGSNHDCYLLTSATCSKTIVAYAITSTVVDEAELLNITVNPAYQRQGIGLLLLDYISDSFEATISTLFLEVRRSNSPAIALYDASGFNEVGVRANYYPSNNGDNYSREDALIMAKALSL
ncbi:ribosomal protein S18-alanine N-acetyltransferase [Eionea flava]